jgi:uncharacterized membrane protein YoaK (UPF0700 family)
VGGHQKLSIYSRPAADLLLLTSAAGMMDALSYLRLGVFTANMTGNTVVLGLALIGIAPFRAIPCVLALGAFALGAMFAGMLVVRPDRGPTWNGDIKLGLALELPFVSAFALLATFSTEPPPHSGSLALLATAACGLGIQSVAVRRLKVSGVVTTFITGTITTVIVSLVAKSKPAIGAVSEEPSSPLLLIAMLVCYVLAAAAGGALSRNHRVLSAFLPVAAIGAVQVRSFKG